MQGQDAHTLRGAQPDPAAQAPGAPHVPGSMRPAPGLAIDIETTGLGPDCMLTCVCTWDGSQGHTLFFRTQEEFAVSKRHILQLLHSCPLIYAYNGGRFDLPVLSRCLGHPIGPWMAKLVDPLYAAKAILGPAGTMPLSNFLSLNQLPSKSGSGAHAVQLALEGRWEDLGHYCMDDTRLTYEAIGHGAWTNGWRYDPWEKTRIFTTPR